MISRLIPSLFLVSCLLSGRVDAQRDLSEIPPPDPEIERASFKVAEGFEVNLWASDPLLAKPTQINFDREGRLWVSSSQTYPQLNVNQDPSDRILVLEDTDDDGTADASSVFYDQLLIPGGVLPDGTGGAYVAHAEELIHLEDTDGDGKADRRKTLLSGFGTEDTHHTLHRLQWGPDGLIYMLQGYYIGTHVETLYGPRRLNGGGLWSYDTRTRRLEVYSRGLVNPWGMAFDRWGQTFQTDGAGREGINYSFPDSVFKASPLEPRVLSGLNPDRPKLSGIEVISGSHFPESWNGSLLANDFRANNIDRYLIEEKESGYRSTLLEDILQSSHVAFRPVDIAMGPDGAVYIADWYSPIIQHGEVDFRDTRRDQIHGRIWRISAIDRPLERRVAYENASIGELLDHLKADADWVRLNAKQALKERDETEAISAIGTWLAGLDSSDPDYEHHRLEALWAYQTVSTKPSRDLAHALVQSADHRARAAATRVLYHWGGSLEVLGALVSDPHPRVRREAVTALGRSHSPQAASLALKALDQPMDEFLDFALWRTCRLLEPYWLPAFLERKLDFGGNADRLTFALKAIERPEALAPLAKMLEEDDAHVDASTVQLIGKIGSAENLNGLVKIASTKGHRLSVSAGLALVKAAEDRGLLPAELSGRLDACQQLLASHQGYSVAAGCRLIGLWDLESLQAALAGHLSSPVLEVRRAAARSLADMGKGALLRQVATSSEANIENRVSASAALVSLDPIVGARAVSRLLAQAMPESAVEELLGGIVMKKGAVKALAEALRESSIPEANAILASRIVETSGHGDSPLMDALTKAGALKPVLQSLDQARMSTLLAKLSEGDSRRGEAIYKRSALACVTCHSIDGEGGSIGPDLSSIGASAPVDYLIESLIEPSKKIKEGYRMSVVTTKKGDIVAGAIVSEDQNVLVSRSMANVETRVPKSSIASRKTSPVSMMPSGLTASLGEDELVDLISYMASLGKQK